MNDRIIILNTLEILVNDDHPFMYQYINGNIKKRDIYITKIVGMLAKIYISVFNIDFITSVTTSYLNGKVKDYKKGILKVNKISLIG